MDFPDRFVRFLQKMGPVFIKFGQALATRSDIIGDKISKALGVLHDKVPPNPYSVVRKIIEKDFDKPLENLFLHFEQIPIGSASVAQVHKAKMMDGRYVAVKVLRMGINKRFLSDIRLIYSIAFLLQLFLPKRFKLIEVVNTFASNTKFELDLRFEASNCAELRENTINDEGFYVPEPFWDYTSRNVFTMEWINGDAIYEHTNNIDLAEKLAINFFKQVYRDNFFHGDLHPGNLIVTNDNKIAAVDFGIMGRVDQETKFYVAEILIGFLTRDYKYVAEIHFIAGYVDPKHVNFISACRAIGESVVGKSADNISVAKLLEHLLKVTSDFDMDVQPQLLLLQKNTVFLEHNCRSLCSSVNVWEAVRPYMDLWARKNLSLRRKLFNRSKLALMDLLIKLMKSYSRLKPKAKYNTNSLIYFFIILVTFVSCVKFVFF